MWDGTKEHLLGIMDCRQVLRVVYKQASLYLRKWGGIRNEPRTTTDAC